MCVTLLHCPIQEGSHWAVSMHGHFFCALQSLYNAYCSGVQHESGTKETASVQQCWYFNKTSEAIICMIIPGTATDGNIYAV